MPCTATPPLLLLTVRQHCCVNPNCCQSAFGSLHWPTCVADPPIDRVLQCACFKQPFEFLPLACSDANMCVRAVPGGVPSRGQGALHASGTLLAMAADVALDWLPYTGAGTYVSATFSNVGEPQIQAACQEAGRASSSGYTALYFSKMRQAWLYLSAAGVFCTPTICSHTLQGWPSAMLL